MLEASIARTIWPLIGHARAVRVRTSQITGDPDIYISFDNPLPTGANYTFVQDKVGVDVFEIGRNNCAHATTSGTRP